MSARPWAWLLLLAACNAPDGEDPGAVPRCAELTELMVTENAAVLTLGNTHGDARPELWLETSTSVDTTWFGHAPQPDGSYQPQWTFERRGRASAAYADFDGDGHEDVLMFADADHEHPGYHRSGPDGLPQDERIDLLVEPGELTRWWHDLDGDGRLERLGWRDGDLLLHWAGAEAATPFGLSLPEIPDVRLASGDPQLLLIDPGPSEDDIVGRIDREGFTSLWTSPKDRFSVLPSGLGVHDDHIDVFARRFVPRGPDELVLVRLDHDGTELQERVIDREVGGHHVHVYDFDGDGHRDLLIDRDFDDPRFRYGDADDRFETIQPPPEAVSWSDVGIRQRYDFDDDGSTELLIAVPHDGMRLRLRVDLDLCQP